MLLQLLRLLWLLLLLHVHRVGGERIDLAAVEQRLCKVRGKLRRLWLLRGGAQLRCLWRMVGGERIMPQHGSIEAASQRMPHLLRLLRMGLLVRLLHLHLLLWLWLRLLLLQLLVLL